MPAPVPAAGTLGWHETFERPLDWIDPLQHTPAELASVYTLRREGALGYLHARHDRSASSKPPAMHYGEAFQTNPIPLEKVRALRWRWRVTQHPAIGKDPWADLGASIYVLLRKPSVLHGGKGFKLGWTAAPAKPDHQRGLLELSLRSDPASREWKSESVDLCALFQKEYGSPCRGESIQYIGVMTDADNTRSVSEGDYADLQLEVAP